MSAEDNAAIEDRMIQIERFRQQFDDYHNQEDK
jgi:hypothetical protein